MLSDRHHFYDINDLVEKCNEKLINAGLSEVTRRCIEKDINYLEYDPFFADIERFRVNGKRCLRYSNPSYTIFRKELSEEESNLILEVLNTIGQFEGLSHFEWLNKFKVGLGLKDRPRIISFSNNPYLQNSNLLGKLFDNISNEVVIKLSYHTFADDIIRSIDFHPYLLKQYNNRWYLLGAADSDKKLLHFALDRIDKVEPLPEKKYLPCSEDLTERFEDIVGVTLYEDRPMEHILCWASENSKGYVNSKPIHGSYTPIKGEKDRQLRGEYPKLEGGMFFTLDCIKNYELVRELCSYGKDLVVLSPQNIKDEILRRTNEVLQKYKELI